jgi:lipopolysaccharide export system protein LptA
MVVALLFALLGLLGAASAARAAGVDLPQADRRDAITITAQAANHWQSGNYECWVLRGDCRIVQGGASAQAQEAVVWIVPKELAEEGCHKVIAYLEGDVVLQAGPGEEAPRLADRAWFGRFLSVRPIEVRAARVAGQPDAMPPVYQRGMALREPLPPGTIRQAQFVESAGPAAVDAVPPGTRRIRVFPRGDVPVQAQWFPDPQSQDWIAVVDSGVNLIVEGLDEYGAIDVSTDRLVIWTKNEEEPDLTGRRGQDRRRPLEIYMEGNIVFRQGERVIHADRMYYNVAQESGVVLGAEVLSPVRSYEGLVRLRAELLQQSGRDRFFARGAFITSSRMGRPGYRIQSAEVYYEDVQRPAFDPWTGLPLLDPETGQPIVEHDRLATSRNNTLFLGPVPILWWPTLATNLEEPTFYLRRIRLKNDRVFGMQVLTDWNAYQIFGIRQPPAGTEWDFSIDYMSDRGLGHGTSFAYGREGFLGIPGPAFGLVDYWGIKDDGLDDLGLGRRALEPERTYRGRLLWKHRQLLSPEYQLTAEAGWLSDRNFLQNFFWSEWDTLKDQTTNIELKHLRDNRTWDLTAGVRVNDFFTQTEWLPRFDHHWLGQDLFGETLTWFGHTSLAYARFQRLDPPANPADQPFSFLPWEASSRRGERLITRHELDWPFQVGPVKVVPYALGELAHWGEDLTGNDLQRAYYQVGLRASLPMWRANPHAESQLWNVHGLAHKVVFNAEFAFAEASKNLDRLPLYDPLDDDSIEAARRRFLTDTFGSPSVVPPIVAAVDPRFDERFYAVRTGMAGWVTAPSLEIAEDLMAFRFGAHQRWQTKRGTPGRRRIIDWVVLDTNITLYPDADRDNFGTAAGLLDYNFRWHPGDRLTLVSEGVFDFFHDGQKIVTVGGFLSRPPRGNFYLGMRILEGPISNQVLSLSYNYWMTPKWVSTFGMSVDLGRDGNIGQNYGITRIGESLLVSAGVNVDAARNNVGAALLVEPRFLPKGRLRSTGGVQIPVAGAYGLE